MIEVDIVPCHSRFKLALDVDTKIVYGTAKQVNDVSRTRMTSTNPPKLSSEIGFYPEIRLGSAPFRISRLHLFVMTLCIEFAFVSIAPLPSKSITLLVSCHFLWMLRRIPPLVLSNFLRMSLTEPPFLCSEFSLILPMISGSPIRSFPPSSVHRIKSSRIPLF
jgi:hypothetical protein